MRMPKKTVQIKIKVSYEPVTDEAKFDRAMRILALMLREHLEKARDPQEHHAENKP